MLKTILGTQLNDKIVPLSWILSPEFMEFSKKMESGETELFGEGEEDITEEESLEKLDEVDEMLNSTPGV